MQQKIQEIAEQIYANYCFWAHFYDSAKVNLVWAALPQVSQFSFIRAVEEIMTGHLEKVKELEDALDDAVSAKDEHEAKVLDLRSIHEEDMRDLEIKLEKSVGGVIAGVANKINELLEKLNSVSPDEMKELVSQSQGLLKGLENSPASAVFVESGKNKASKVQ